MPKDFIKERFWVLPFMVQRVSFENVGYVVERIYVYTIDA
jgi:hypothetical protein